MPRRRTEVAATTPRPTGIVAAATNYAGASSSTPKAKKIRREGWQLQAWTWYDEIGEYRFAVSWVGNLLSRAELYCSEGGQLTTNPVALEAMSLLFGGPDGQTEMLRQLGIQFTVAGEAFVIGEDRGDDVDDAWYVVSAVELTNTGDVYKFGGREVSNPLVIRLWKPHPRKYEETDSPTRAVLPILAEIDGLTKHVAAQIDSRLAGAGMLLVPQEISFGSTNQTQNGSTSPTNTVDELIEALMESMTTAIQNRENASALVPIVLQAPGDHLDNVRHVTFSTPLDEHAIELRNEAIRRLALGMDMPPEVLTGTGDMNHWGAWQVEEAAIKSHTEPLLDVITESLTEGYLWPILQSAGVDNYKDFVIAADTAKMRLRPNRSKEAIELYDRGELSAAAMLRENGFDPADAMGRIERIDWLTRRLAGGTPSPESVVEALRVLGVAVSEPPVDGGEIEQVNEERPTRSLEEHPVNELPETDVAAAEVLIFRALERAGNRLKNRRTPESGVAQAMAAGVAAADLYLSADTFTGPEIDDLLDDAWAHASRFCNIPVSTLNLYARGLLATRTAHHPTTFRRFLSDPRLQVLK